VWFTGDFLVAYWEDNEQTGENRITSCLRQTTKWFGRACGSQFKEKLPDVRIIVISANQSEVLSIVANNAAADGALDKKPPRDRSGTNGESALCTLGPLSRNGNGRRALLQKVLENGTGVN